MSSWEEIADEIAPAGVSGKGLATGARRRMPRAALRVPPLDPHIVRPPHCTSFTPLQQVLLGDERDTEYGPFFHVARRADAYHAMFADLAELIGASLPIINRKTRATTSVEDLLFLDIETTGLSPGTPLFLIGALSATVKTDATLELFLARGIDEERAALISFLDLVEGKTLVSFNGVNFDWPYITARALKLGLTVPKPRAHFDLLPFSRQIWKAQVPNCRLQTLEYYICGRSREGDTPSSEIPRRYRQFAQMYAGNGRGADVITPIAYHNIWDVLTMADLLRHSARSATD